MRSWWPGILPVALGGLYPLAAQDVPADAMDAAAPLDPMVDIGVDWPDMQAAEPAGDTIATPVQTIEARRYHVGLEGIEGIEGLARQSVLDRFNALSALKAGEKTPANSAQIDRRIREDSHLLESILRAAGYYDPQIDSEVSDGVGGALSVRLLATPGPRYRFAAVDVEGLAATGDQASEFGRVLGLAPNAAVDADAVLEGTEKLRKSLNEQGYPFATIGEPDVTIDHETQTASIAVQIDPAGKRRFGTIQVKGARPPFGAEHVAIIARFKPGKDYDAKLLDDLRRALTATGVVGAVSVAPVPAVDPALADIQVSLEPAPLRTIAGELGYGTGQGLRAEASWTHRNLIGAEGALTAKAVVGTREQELGVALRKANFRARDIVLGARFGVANTNLPAFEARTITLALGLDRQSNTIWQKRWTWSAGADLLATDERDFTANALTPRRTFLIAALPLSLGYDRSNDLLDPVRGFRLGARIVPELSLRNGSNAYVRLQFDASGYVPVSQRVTLAARGRLGSIVGADTLTLAPSRRFYAGGGSSVRGYSFQRIGPADSANDPIGGRSLAEFSLEARVRWRDLGFVPFLDGGNIYSDARPRLTGFRYGAGLGVRYHSQFGPIRVDIGTPLNGRRQDAPITVFVSLGQAF